MRKESRQKPAASEIGRLRSEIREREEDYRNLIDGSVQGIVIRNAARRLFVNDACVGMFGYDSAEELLALEDSYLLFAPHEREIMRQRHLGRLRGEPLPDSYEIECLRKDGSTLWVFAVAKMVTWQGEPAIQATFTDISERKSAEEELRRSEQRHRELIHGLPLGICIHRDLRPVFVNDAYARTFGYDSGRDIIELGSIDCLVAPEERPRLEAYRRARMAGKEAPSQYDYQGLRKDGTRITCSTMVRVIDWDGEPTIQHCIVDITERERQERRLRVSEERYRELIEGSVQGISIRGAKRRLLVNDSFARMFGYASAEEVLAEETPRCVSAPHGQERVLATHYAILEGRQAPIQFEFEGERNDGSRIWLNAIMRRVEWEGEPAVQTACTDITESKLAEQSLRASERRYRDLIDRDLIEGSVQGINIRGAKKRLLVNDSLAKMLGYSTREMMATAEPFTRAAPHDRERLRAIHESLLRRKQAPKHYEFEGLRKDGATIWLSAVARRIEWDGEPAVQNTYTDITERKLAEEELRSSEERYRDLFEGSVQGILIRTDRPLLVNEAVGERGPGQDVRLRIGQGSDEAEEL
jgi:PAS domain S-box-containing protein